MVEGSSRQVTCQALLSSFVHQCVEDVRYLALPILLGVCSVDTVVCIVAPQTCPERCRSQMPGHVDVMWATNLSKLLHHTWRTTDLQSNYGTHAHAVNEVREVRQHSLVD